jgi:hypothetical protein
VALNNSFKNHWHLCIKRKMCQEDCEPIRIHSDWDERELSLDRVQVTHLKISFELRPNAPSTR